MPKVTGLVRPTELEFDSEKKMWCLTISKKSSKKMMKIWASKQTLIAIQTQIDPPTPLPR